MKVNKQDGDCRDCRGDLEVVEVGDATMTVECLECGETYAVEPDAFGDGGVTYYVGFLTEQAEAEGDSRDDGE